MTEEEETTIACNFCGMTVAYIRYKNPLDIDPIHVDAIVACNECVRNMKKPEVVPNEELQNNRA